MINNSAISMNETIPLFDAKIAGGHAYRFSTGRQIVTNSGEYLTLHFHTPDSGSRIYYNFARIAKTGGEVEVTLIEGGTYSGGVSTDVWAMNRRLEYKNIPSGITDVKYGVSTTATISGGIAAPSYVIPGTSIGVMKSGGASEGGFLSLQPNQDYTVKCTLHGTNTYIDIMVSLAIIR